MLWLASAETHPELLQVHHQTVVRKTGGKPAEEDRQLLVHGWTSTSKKIFKQLSRTSVGLLRSWTGKQEVTETGKQTAE